VIHHVVLFRWISSATPDQVAAAGAALAGMKGKIPEVRGVAFGPNLAESRTEYTHALLVVVDDMAAVKRYVDHPHHVEVVKTYLAPIREARLAIDLEVPTIHDARLTTT
jgi:hypothetical protein